MHIYFLNNKYFNKIEKIETKNLTGLKALYTNIALNLSIEMDW